MFLILFLVVLLIIYYLLRRNFSYWEKLGVPGPKPTLIFGNLGQNFLGKKSTGEIYADIYKKYEGYPFVGVYRTGTPCILLRDEEIIKNVIVKDFKHFTDNEIFVDKDVDPIFGRNPFMLKGEEWKKTRTELTPCFSSGKMKALFPTLETVSRRLVKFVANEMDGTNSVSLDTKELCTKFTCDNVALSAFGIEGKCFDEPNSEFRDLAHRFLSPNSWAAVKTSMMVFIPKLANLVSVKFVARIVEEKLLAIVRATRKYREENNIVRNDFMDSVCQLAKESSSFTEIDIAAHAASFFIDGFETSSNVMCFALFDLAMNQDCQTKLRNEINSILEKHNGKFTYDALQEMTYLDACLKESLRLYPQLPSEGKTCTERYTLTSIGSEYKNLSVTLEPGTPVILPILGLHMDPKFYPSPEKYLPERHLEKNNINKYVYLPFGEGPRKCLGQRFGQLQIKIGLLQIIRNYELKVNKKTQLPFKYLPFYLLLFPKGGVWLDFYKV